MKRLLLALLICSASQETLSAGVRNVIMLLDWSEETLLERFKDQAYQFKHKEPGTAAHLLLAALQQKAAPIIVSSRTWYNAIEPGKIFADIVRSSAFDLSYFKQYPMLGKPQNLKLFKSDLLKDYDRQKDLIRVSADTTSFNYYMSYQTFFSKNPIFNSSEWIIKKFDDFLYVLVPLAYLKELEQGKDTPTTARQLSISLTERERMLGMKIDKLADIPSNTLLDLNAHATRINYPWPERMLSITVLEAMPQLFVTRSDLTFPGGNKEETDINEAYFLQEWLVCLFGHGSQSISGQEESLMALTGGLMQDDFRKLLSFFNNRVKTGSLLYISCYSGGKHLFTLFEHQWDYPKTQKIGKELQVGEYPEAVQIVTTEKGEKVVVTKREVEVADIFNYLIIAANQFYTSTQSAIFSYKTTGEYYNSIRGESLLDFTNYFKSMAQFLHPAQSGAKKNNLIPAKEQLERIIGYVHPFTFENKYQIPAIRFANTERFLSLHDLGRMVIPEHEEVIRPMIEREIERKQRLIEEARTKEISQKVQESIKAYELRVQEKERQEKESKELSGRIEKLRREQEERENIEPKTIPIPIGRPLPKGPLSEEKARKEKEARMRLEKERKAQEWFEAREKGRSQLTPQTGEVGSEEKTLKEKEERKRLEKERKAQEWFEAMKKGPSVSEPVESSVSQ